MAEKNLKIISTVIIDASSTVVLYFIFENNKFLDNKIRCNFIDFFQINM